MCLTPLKLDLTFRTLSCGAVASSKRGGQRSIVQGSRAGRARRTLSGLRSTNADSLAHALTPFNKLPNVRRRRASPMRAWRSPGLTPPPLTRQTSSRALQPFSGGVLGGVLLKAAAMHAARSFVLQAKTPRPTAIPCKAPTQAQAPYQLGSPMQRHPPPPTPHPHKKARQPVGVAFRRRREPLRRLRLGHAALPPSRLRLPVRHGPGALNGGARELLLIRSGGRPAGGALARALADWGG
jgi:hypothetical protein